jgi:hypothetical protein
MKIKNYTQHLLATLCVSTMFIGACSSSNDPTVVPDAQIPGSDNPDDGGGNDSTGGIRTLEIDARAGGFGASADDPTNKWTYVNFDSGQIVELTDAQADESTGWHMAFKRVGVRVNGGASGPGNVSAALIDAQSRFYNEDGEPDVAEFSAATDINQYAALEQTVNTNELSFAVDSDKAAIDGNGLDEQTSWWLYNRSDNTVNANANVWTVVRGAGGETFAKVHVTNIDQAERQVSIEMFIQSTGSDAFSSNPVVWTAAIGGAGGALCYDFEETLEVDCVAQASTWDLQVEVSPEGRSWEMWTNSGEVRGQGAQGSSFGPLTSNAQAGFNNAASVPTWFEDQTGGVFQSDSWYAYNLQENNRIWPNYRVYGIDTTIAKYKLQILGYYDETGLSGNISLRFDSID